MPKIVLHIDIEASLKVVFDLARSVDVHKQSTARTKESIIAGRSNGLMEFGETVTWRAKHFGVFQTLTSKITAMQPPSYFVDEMVQGVFHSFKHEHIFEYTETGVRMIDVFEYQSPLGIIGKLADVLFLKKYMTKFLMQRNQEIKSVAEKKAKQHSS